MQFFAVFTTALLAAAATASPVQNTNNVRDLDATVSVLVNDVAGSLGVNISNMKSTIDDVVKLLNELQKQAGGAANSSSTAIATGLPKVASTGVPTATVAAATTAGSAPIGARLTGVPSVLLPGGGAIRARGLGNFLSDLGTALDAANTVSSFISSNL